MDGTLERPEETRRAASVIHAEAIRMEEMSRTLLALAALDAESSRPAAVPVDLVTLREALDERFAPSAFDARLSLDIRIDDAPRPVGDSERLLQAASAIVSNALWYTPVGGTVRVRSCGQDSTWRLEIDDSGPGIPPERRAAVFDRFVRLDPSRSKGSGGVGLGLAIAKRAVDLMGGTIEAGESEDLGGARFVIELPLASRDLT